MLNRILFSSIFVLGGCVSASPIISTPELEQLKKNAEHHNESVKSFIGNQVLLNVLRAQHHDLRRYTAISNVTMNPGGSYERSAALAGPGLGNNIGDPWGTLSGGLKASSNDSLSYTFATATNSNDKDFSEVRFTSETLNEFWLQSWPRSLLIEVFFDENAKKIIKEQSAFDALKSFYSSESQGREPFYVLSDHGALNYCFDSILACIDENDPPEKRDDKPATTNQSVDINLTVKSEISSKTPAVSKAKKSYTWKGNPGGNVSAKRIRDTHAKTVDFGEVFRRTMVDDEGAHYQPPKFELIYCAPHTDHKIITDKGYKGTTLTSSRDIDIFKCSLNLSDVNKAQALPYFLILEGEHPGIYSAQLNTFDEATYLMGRSLRSGKEDSKSTEASFCNPNFPDPDKCKISKLAFKVYTETDLKTGSLKKCKDHFFAKVDYRDTTYYAGLPEEGDSLDNTCVDEDSITSSTMILFAKIAEFSIKKPQNNTQLLLTQ